MKDGVYISNQQHEIIFVNPALIREFGPIENKKCYEYFLNRETPCSNCRNNEIFQGKTVRWEWKNIKNNKIYDLIATRLSNPDNSYSKLEIFRDITDYKLMEK